MDAITHVLAGAVLGMLVFWRRHDRARFAAIGGAAALAPDLDVVFAPLSLLDPFYWASHRGFTHSLLGAPVVAVAFVALLGRLSRRIDRLRAFAPVRGRMGAALLASWSHLLLDGITHHGVPWAWPLSDVRWAMEWYYWMVIWLAPVSLLALWKRYRGRWDDGTFLRAAAVVAVILLVVGGIRLAGRPVPDEGEVFSRQSPFEWTIVRTHDNGSIQAVMVRQGEIRDEAWYLHDAPGDAQWAVAAARESIEFRAFAFEGFGHYAFQAEPAADGWNITVLDAVARFEWRDRPDWVPERWIEDQGRLRLHVGPAGVREYG